MSKTYCAFPFSHQYVHMSGSVRLCCATMDNAVNDKGQRFHVNNDSLEKIWNSDYMKQVRLKMLRGEPLKECTKCVDQETRGYKSMRDKRNKEKNIALTNTNGSIKAMPYTMELHFGNMCNLKCKMCGQNYSNQIGKEILEIGKTDKDFLNWVYKQSANVNNWTNNLSVEYNWFQNEKTKNKLTKFVNDHIITLTVIGGEPTIIPEFYELLDYCGNNDTLKDKNITIVTNLTNTNPKMTQWLPKTKSWVIWASIDGLGDRTEYIRYPSNFDKVVENLEFYKKLIKESGNGKLVFSPAVQLLNIDQLDDMLKWFINFADGDFPRLFDVSWMSQVWYPKICNYDMAPEEYRFRIADKLAMSSKYFKQYNNIHNFYQTQITNLKQDHLSKQERRHLQQSFIRYNDTQDKHRGKTTWRQLLPYLEETLTKSLR